MISLLEGLAQIVNVIFVWYNKSTTLASLTLAIIIFDILLPHAFLMNTSQNKNRIVEIGWKSVLKNILGISNNSVGNSENTATVYYGGDDVETEIEQKGKKKKRSKQTGDVSVPGRNNSLRVNKRKDSAISDITLNGECSGYKETAIDKTNFTTLNVNNLEQRSHNQDVLQILLSELMISGNDEERYMIYFKKFVAFQDSRKNGKVVSDIELEDEFLPNIKQSNKYISKISRNKGTHNKPTGLQIAVLEKELNRYKEEVSYKSNDRHLNLKGKLEDRFLLRTEILKDIRSASFAKQTKKYDDLVENFIDLEESFVIDC